MSNIFIYSASGPEARVHYKKTIEEGIDLGDVFKFINDENDKNILTSKYASDGKAYLWAGKSAISHNGKKSHDESYWDQMQQGDLVLAYSRRAIIAVSHIILKNRNSQLGNYCWPNLERPYDLIFFLSKPIFVNKLVADITDKNGRSYFGEIYQGLRRLRRSDDIVRDFKTLQSFKAKALGVDLRSESDLFEDIENHKSEFSYLDKTERENIIKSRIGQGQYRDDLIGLWGGCSITGLPNYALLRASHIKPWRNSTNSERLDPYNGLLLLPNLDLLFDLGFVSFDDNGKIIFSTKLSNYEKAILHLSDNLSLKKVYPENIKYLSFHRANIFRD